MSKNRSDSSDRDEGKSGNTKQISPTIRWCFTLHNYKNSDIENILSVSSDSSKFSIFSKELGKSGETPHLQGYIEFKKRVRPTGLFENKQIHWEKSKGDRESNVRYITKEKGDYYLNGKMIRGLQLITELYEWQQKIVDIVVEPPDNRTIHWFWEPDGNRGKSAFVKYLCAKYSALILSNKATDMKHGVVGYMAKHDHAPDIILVDIPRSVSLDYISYTGFEEVKNGCFFSPKYESDMCIYNSPHFIVFANEPPDLDEMSADRWNVVKI